MTASVSGTWVLNTYAALWSGSPPVMPVTVYKGTNRRFYVVYLIRGSRFVNEDLTYMTLPTLVGPRGVAYAQGRTNADWNNFNASGETNDLASMYWYWDEAELAAAGIPIGEDTVCYITDIAHTPNPTWGTIEEQFWAAGTLRDLRQADGGAHSGGSSASDNYFAPNTPPAADPDEPTLLNLAISAYTPDTITVLTFPGYTELINFNDGGNMSAYIHAGEFEDDASRVTLTMNATPTSARTVIKREWSHPIATAAARSGGMNSQRPQIKQVSAKTIADKYNQGSTLQHDYEFSRGRKTRAKGYSA